MREIHIKTKDPVHEINHDLFYFSTTLLLILYMQLIKNLLHERSPQFTLFNILQQLYIFNKQLLPKNTHFYVQRAMYVYVINETCHLQLMFFFFLFDLKTRVLLSNQAINDTNHCLLNLIRNGVYVRTPKSAISLVFCLVSLVNEHFLHFV